MLLLRTTMTKPSSGRLPAKDTYPSCSPPWPTVPGGPAHTPPVHTRRAWPSSRTVRLRRPSRRRRRLATNAPGKGSPTPCHPPARRTSMRGTGGSRHPLRGCRVRVGWGGRPQGRAASTNSSVGKTLTCALGRSLSGRRRRLVAVAVGPALLQPTKTATTRVEMTTLFMVIAVPPSRARHRTKPRCRSPGGSGRLRHGGR